MQSSQRSFCWFFLFRGLRDNALCCTDPPLRSLLLLRFFLGLFHLVSCGCLLLRLFLGETPAWRFPLVRVVVLAPASASFFSQRASSCTLYLLSAGAIRNCGRRVLCRFQEFFHFPRRVRRRCCSEAFRRTLCFFLLFTRTRRRNVGLECCVSTHSRNCGFDFPSL